MIFIRVYIYIYCLFIYFILYFIYIYISRNIHVYIFLGSGILSGVFSSRGSICAAQELLTGDTPHCQVPGGFGAVGQPNDAWHQFHHCLVKAFASTSLQWKDHFDLRKDLYKLQKSVQGSNQTKFLGSLFFSLFLHEDACGSTRLQ